MWYLTQLPAFLIVRINRLISRHALGTRNLSPSYIFLTIISRLSGWGRKKKRKRKRREAFDEGYRWNIVQERVIRNIRQIISFYELSFGVLFTASNSYYYSSSILRPDIFGRILINNTVLYGRCRLICVRNLSDSLCSYCTPY